MSIKCDEYNQVCVIALIGDFVGEDSLAVRKHIDELIDQRQIVDYVLDIEKSGFLDSDGLETLVWIRKRCEDLFGQIKLANLDENCKKILEITRLAHRFECCPDLPGALKTMR